MTNTNLEAASTDERAIVALHYANAEHAHNWHGGEGWYWWEEEYPEEGVCGPYPTKAAAIKDMSSDHVLRGEDSS